MSKKQFPILSIAAAIGALLPQAGAQAAINQTVDSSKEQFNPAPGTDPTVNPADVNLTLDVGGNYLGFVVSENAEGIVTAYHSSHQSHSSHSSHRSHYSSR